MSRNPNFRPVVDEEDLQIKGYEHSGGEFRLPTAMAEVIDGNERVQFRGGAYTVDERGNLINERVGLPELLTIGYGVLIGAGVEFRYSNADIETILLSGSTIYDPRARRQIICAGLRLGENSTISAHSVGPNADIGSNIDILSGVKIGADFTLGDSSGIGRDCQLGDHNEFGADVRVGFESSTGNMVVLGAGTRIGIKNRIGNGTVFDECVTTADRQIIGNHVWLPKDFNAADGLDGGREILDGENFLGADTKVLPPPSRRLRPLLKAS